MATHVPWLLIARKPHFAVARNIRPTAGGCHMLHRRKSYHAKCALPRMLAPIFQNMTPRLAGMAAGCRWRGWRGVRRCGVSQRSPSASLPPCPPRTKCRTPTCCGNLPMPGRASQGAASYAPGLSLPPPPAFCSSFLATNFSKRASFLALRSRLPG